jgi:hypothetical protein
MVEWYMGSTARRCGVYGGEFFFADRASPVYVVEKEWKKGALETGQRLRGD